MVQWRDIRQGWWQKVILKCTRLTIKKPLHRQNELDKSFDIHCSQSGMCALATRCEECFLARELRGSLQVFSTYQTMEKYVD